ncbi:PAS domain S-box protein [Roseomonas indoligenes]|uniref:PAS domain S-box protein n=1 Tax=Roseomonas indoligenes TaxID=2820811 RepID=A0A940N6G5_9PROT|nr:PAS domain S-box protein [Pararoseomonas indoligenes]MBP0495007.1 PAS domain S-box protein [Pararoseomonas indoligenes]
MRQRPFMVSSSAGSAGASDRECETTGTWHSNPAETFHLLLNGVQHPILVKDREGRWLAVNDAACALMCIDREEALLRTDHDLLPREQADRNRATDDEVFGTGNEQKTTEQVALPGGKVHVVTTLKRLVTLPGPSGGESFLVVSFTDLTHEQQISGALRESQEDQHYAYALSPQIPWTADPEGRILEAGPRWFEFTGMTREELREAGWLPAIHPDERESAGQSVAASLATGQPLDLECRFRLRDGTYRWFRARAAARRDEHGAVARWYGTTEDIHDRKLAEIALRESETRFRKMADDAPVIVWVADPDGTATFFSQLWTETTGQAVSEALGSGWMAAVHPEDHAKIEQAFEVAAARSAPFRVEYRLRRSGGDWAWVIDAGQPRFGRDGSFLGYVGSILDITERREMEAALRESEEHYRYSVELSPQIPWTATPEGMVDEVGLRWHGQIGMSRQETLGAGWARALHPDDAERALQGWDRSLRSGEPLDHEYRLQLSDGSYRWFRARAAARRDAGGRIVRWYGTLENIQDRKAAEQALRESEAFARTILENSPDCVRILDIEGRLLFMNEAGHHLLDLDSTADLDTKIWGEIIPPEYREMIEGALAAAMAGKTSRFTTHRFKRDGSVQWLDTIVGYIPGAEDRPARLLSISRDVTSVRQAREAAETARREAEAAAARLSAVLESTMDGVLMLDHDWRVTYASQNARRLLQDRGFRTGASVWTMFPDEMDGVFAAHYRKVMTEQVPVAFEEYLASVHCWFEVHAYPAPEGISIFFRDVTQRREAERERLAAQEKITHMARHDALTGLPNRILFRERLGHILKDRRPGMRTAVLSLDLDGFGAINDTFGHAVGDTLLGHVVERIQSHLRGSDTLARFGGDEFAIVQPSVQQPEDAARLACRIVALLSKPFELHGQQIIIGTSVGVAIAPEDGRTADDLLKSAGVALFGAKSEGRGTHAFFRPGMHERLRTRQAIKAAMIHALPRGEFELHYQPLVRLKTGEISCFEALLRWRHPERGLISPADFIPVAEETGLIVSMGEWALREACSRAAGWPAGCGVAVNLSPAQFRSAGLVDAVSRTLSDSGLQPELLQIEITESLMLQDSTANLDVLRGLRSLGVRIAMDDFGTGYSSLSYLRSFPFDKIKLDQSFVRELPDGQEARAIIRAVAGLGATLGVTTTAEGIETLDQLRILLSTGYDEGQGYLFSKPVADPDVAQLTEAIRKTMSSLLQETTFPPL